jgi:hypothetical protein
LGGACAQNPPHLTVETRPSGVVCRLEVNVSAKECPLMSALELRQPVDQRQDERYPFKQPAAGVFLLQTPDGSHPIALIKDISSNGMRIHLDVALEAGVKVVVVYAGPEIKAEVNGMVVWCQERAPEADEHADEDEEGSPFMIGIQLLSPVLLMAMSGLC